MIRIGIGTELEQGADKRQQAMVDGVLQAVSDSERQLEGKGEGLPLSPRCRGRVNSLHLPACGFPATGRPPLPCPK